MTTPASRPASLILGLPVFLACLISSHADAGSTDSTPVYYAPGTTVELTGGTDGFEYAWLKNGNVITNGGRIPFADGANLLIMNCETNDSGRYQLFSPGALEPVADYTVTIETSQKSVNAGPGQYLELYGDPRGDTYQWFKDGEMLTDNGRVFGSRSAVLSIADSQVSDCGDYILECGADPARVNAIWTVNVLEPPAITNFLYRYSGKDVTFEVDATGGGLSYQWYWQGMPIEGATESILTFTNASATANAGYYSVRVWNSIGEISTPPPGLLFTKPLTAGTYQGVFNGGDMDSTGFFIFTLSSSRSTYSGLVIIGGRRYAFSGAFPRSHSTAARLPTWRRGCPSSFTLQLLSTNGTPGVTGEIVFGEDDAANHVMALGHHVPYNSGYPAPQAGRYTMAMHSSEISPVGATPDGYGIASVLVTKSGGVGITGRAADGAAISYSFARLSRIGDCPIYATLYGNRGYLVGWLAVTNAQTGSISGSVQWSRPPSSRAYPDGFLMNLDVVGSTYVTSEIPRDWQLPKLDAMIPFTKATATLTGGDMFVDDLAIWTFVGVSVPAPNTFQAQGGREKLRLDVKAENGRVFGSFVNHKGRTVPIQAILLQQQGCALGYFLSESPRGYFQSGYFSLEGKE